MTRALGLSSVLLVLVNLAFVSITEDARWIWLGPLLGFTIASPLLVPLREKMWYRMLWNVALIGVFVMLVHHARTTGVQDLLEDGLLLAALCQVHLLNNIREGQRPDLLYFNSFLIAVVTSFLSLDLAYSAIFVIYAFVLVVALHLLVLDRAGVREGARRAVLTGLWRGTVALGLTLAVFALWPRDFHRKGLLGDRFKFKPPAMLAQVDFTEDVSLDRTGPVTQSERIVMRVRAPAGGIIPYYWRGATLDGFDGRDWRPVRGVHSAADRPWRDRGGGRFFRDQAADVLEVELVGVTSRRLFAPLHAGRVELGPRAASMGVNPLPDLTFWCRRRPASRGSVEYSVALGTRRKAPAGRRWGGRNRRARPYLYLQKGTVPPEARAMAKRVIDDLPKDAEQHVMVERMRSLLSSRFRYLPPGSEESASDLAEFVSDQAGAHCEYFATTLVLMLRSEGIPCRFVTGYRSDEREGRTLTVRALHAHAWVEVLDPTAGWYTVDPSPAIDVSAVAAQAGLFSRVKRWGARVWEKVTGFNEDMRNGALVALRALPGRVFRFTGAHPLPLTAGGVVLAALLLGWRVQRRRRVPVAVRAYVAGVQRAGILPEPGETPRELLARARALGLPEGRLGILAAATEAHEQSRYVLGSPALEDRRSLVRAGSP